jgi:NAD(P)-dependent dehydrogenase (short-subunit alcohol dehydrogenase family)
MTMSNSTNNSQAGKVWFITGASSGFGRLLAEYLCTLGANVVATARNIDTLSEFTTKYPGNSLILSLDVTKPESIAKAHDDALAHFGRVDVLVNNAGIFLAEPLASTSLESFNRVMDVNVAGVFLGMRAVVTHMSARGSGSIINVSSLAGLTGGPLLTAYAASKWAVRGMTKVAARELARSGVRVNSVHPGQIDTDMNTRQREATPELIERLVRSIPLGRIGTPEEVAHALVYLASDESVYTTGSELVVDGGSSA